MPRARVRSASGSRAGSTVKRGTGYELKFDTGQGHRVCSGIDGNTTTMPKRTTDFREDLLADLADPREAAHYLNAAFEDSEQMALVALRDVAEARQMARVADDAGVAREALYRMLRETRNPTYGSLTGILSALGLKIVFAPATPANAAQQRAPRANRISGPSGSRRKPKTRKRG